MAAQGHFSLGARWLLIDDPIERDAVVNAIHRYQNTWPESLEVPNAIKSPQTVLVSFFGILVPSLSFIDFLLFLISLLVIEFLFHSQAKGRLQMSLREAQLLLLALDAYKSQKAECWRSTELVELDTVISKCITTDCICHR